MAFFAGRRTRRDAYTTTNDQLDSEAPDPTRRIQWTVPLRATRRLYKLADEEHGTVATSIESHRLRDKPPRPKISPKFIAHHDRQTLDIAQTRSYPENEKQETVILTRQDPETHVAGHAASSEIHWVHLEAKFNSMSFEDFQRVAADVPGLEDDEVALVVKMLKNIQSTSEKPFVHGEYGKYLIPSAVRYDGEDPELPKEEEQKCAIFFALPYFDLRPLRKLKRVNKDAPLYLMRTLLQSHHRLASTEDRDKKQAVLKLANSQAEKKHEVLYLPELWCLIINQRIVLTYAAEPLEGTKSLFGKTISTEASRKGPTIVRYETLEGDKHYFPIKQCKTWHHLRQTIKLHEEIFDFDLETRDGQIITESNWTHRISQESSLYIDVYVREPDSETGSNRSSDAESTSTPDAQYELVQPDDDSVSISPTSSEVSHELVEISPTSISEKDDGLIRLFKENQARLRALVDGSHGPSFSAEHLTATAEDLAKSSITDLSSSFPEHFGPPRRAETIGFAPSQAQRLDFESHVNFARGHFRPLQRMQTDESFRSESPIHSPTSNISPVTSNQSHRNASPNFASASPDVRESSSRSHFRRDGLDSRNWQRPPTGLQRHERSIQNPPETNKPTDRTRSSSQAPDHVVRSRQSTGRLRNRQLHSSPEKIPGHRNVSEKQPGRLRKRRRSFSTLGSQDRHSNQQASPQALRSDRHSSATAQYSTKPIFLWPTTKQDVRASGSGDINAIVDDSVTASTPDHSVANQSRPKPQSRSSKGMSVLRGPSEQQVNDTSLENILQDAQKQLEGSENAVDAMYYARAVEKPLSFVESLLDKAQVQEVNEEHFDAPSSKHRDAFNQKEQILHVAKKLLGAFAPVNYPSKVVEKYWGAVSLLLVDSPHQWDTKYKIQSDTEVAEISALSFILGETLDLLAMVEYIITGISPSNDMQQRLDYRIPPALMQAFTHVIMFYIYHGLARVTPDQEESETLYNEGDKCTDRCRDLLTLGLRQLIVILHTSDDGVRVSYEALKPETIVSFVIGNVLDKTLKVNGEDLDVAEIYSEYISQLDLEVHQYPGAKVFGQIRLLGEELEIIEKTLAKQYQLVRDFAQITDERNLPYDDDNLSQQQDFSTYSGKLRRRVLSRTADSLNEKLEDIRELKDRAAFMQWSASQAISIRAESNEKAILTFTVVTVIFLPLSFVTSYLGMNVQDIRDTGRQQSIFWAVALPITAIIGVVIVVLVTGPTSLKWRRWKAAEKMD